MAGKGEFTKKVSMVLAEMGQEGNYRFYPWTRCFDAVVKGRVWAAFPYAYTEERAEKVWYTEPLAVDRVVFFYYEPPGRSRSITIDKIEDLKAYRVGGVTGYYYEPIFRKHGVKVDYTSSEVQGLEKLVRGRIDVMPNSELVGWDLIQRHFPDKVENFKVVDYTFSVNKLGLIVSRKYPGSKKLLKSFNAALDRCRNQGKIESGIHW
jgi:polar amino acid transport system substrate-binding protein